MVDRIVERVALRVMNHTDRSTPCIPAGEIRALLTLVERHQVALEKIRDHARKLRAGTDDWFELVEIEAMATHALDGDKR
jgi:hypothetical protein